MCLAVCWIDRWPTYPECAACRGPHSPGRTGGAYGLNRDQQAGALTDALDQPIDGIGRKRPTLLTGYCVAAAY
jgi:hypothetical protein